MSLTGKKYTQLFSTSDSDADYLTSEEITALETDFNSNDYLKDKDKLSDIGPLLHMLQKITEELDYLRTEIAANKAKTGITTTQANAITANTGNISTNASDISTNSSKVTTNISEIAKTNTALNTTIRVVAYPSGQYSLPPGTIQSHSSEIVFDTLQKKYFLNIYYIEEQPSKGGKGKKVIRMGQIELK